MSDLSPCPNLWCKRNDVTVHGPDMVSDTYCVGCECGIGGPECATESEAVAAWNHRLAEDALVKAWTPRKTNAARFAELLEAIDNRCMAADGPVTPTLSEATADELRKLYLFADRIRKGQI